MTARPTQGGTSKPALSAVASNRKGADGTHAHHLTHARIEQLGRQESSLSRSGSEADSLLDLYRHGSSRDAATAEVDSDIPENMYRPENDDPDGWIHRDKLARIESEELQAAGINLAKARRSMARRTSSREGPATERDQGHVQAREEKPQRTTSPVAENADEAEPTTWDFQGREDHAGDNGPALAAYANPISRKTGSKIPVLSTSPRETPVLRKRTLSGSVSPDEGLSKARPRAGSAGSQVIAEDGTGVTEAPATRASPSKSKASKPSTTTTTTTPSTVTGSRKATPSQRKASATTKTGSPPKTGATSTPRPGTRSGESERPRTAINRPEGDPPWLATMYKHDPRLPPDQQIIPTHARRQQQAQWTEEGAVPNTYDRDFSPLAVHADKDLRPPSQIEAGSTSEAEAAAANQPPWETAGGPAERRGAGLTVRVPPLPPAGASRPGTSDAKTGGYSYSPMPKVPASPKVATAGLTPLGPLPGSQLHPHPHHAGGGPGHDPDRLVAHNLADEDKLGGRSKTGCAGCCVVM